MRKFFKNIPIWAIWILGMLLFLTGAGAVKNQIDITTSKKRAESALKADKYLSEAYHKIEENNIDSAISYISMVKFENIDSSSHKADSLLRMIDFSSSEQEALDALSEMNDAEVRQIQKGTYSRQFIANNQLNLNFINLIIATNAKQKEQIRISKAKEKAAKAELKRQKRIALRVAREEARARALVASDNNLSSSSGYTQGPRGGCYYINSNGNKVYVDRSLCD